MSPLSTTNLSNPHAWDKEAERHQPSVLLLKALAGLIMDNMIKGCMIQEGTLLLAPDRDLDEVLQSRRSTNALDIRDLRGIKIDWTSTNSIIESLQKWVDEGVTHQCGCQAEI